MAPRFRALAALQGSEINSQYLCQVSPNCPELQCQEICLAHLILFSEGTCVHTCAHTQINCSFKELGIRISLCAFNMSEGNFGI